MIQLVSRTLLIPIVFLAWIAYQVIVKKKKWRDLRGDIYVMACFLVGWWGFFYWVLR